MREATKLKKIIGIFFCTILIGTISPVGINATDTHNPLDGGWLEEHGGIKILHISGSSYEMGYQYGFLFILVAHLMKWGINMVFC